MKLNFFLSLCIPTFLCFEAITQPDCKCANDPIPSMFVSKDTAKVREKEINSRKKKKKLRNNFSTQYKALEFIRLLNIVTSKDSDAKFIYNGLRIYIGAASSSRTFDNNVFFIFAPTLGRVSDPNIDDPTITYTDSRDYYIWSQTTSKFILTNYTEAKKFVSNFTKSKLKDQLDKVRYDGLLHSGIIGKRLKDNSSMKGDSKSILYRSIHRIGQLKKEFEICQIDYLKNIRIQISSYAHNRKKKEQKYPNRLTLHFIMMANNKQPYSIEDNKLCYEARKSNKDNFNKDTQYTEGAFDTGDPCPPNGNCDGALLFQQ